MGIGNTCHSVGDPGASGHQGHAQTSSEFCMGMRHIHRSALIAYVNDTNTLGIEPHPDGHDVSAAEGKHPINLAGFKKSCDQCRCTLGGNMGCAHSVF
jgi:hypothetical protein